MAKLVFVDGCFEGREVALPETGVTIGRSERCNLTLDDQKISGQHALLRRQGDSWWLYDCHSTNGTTVNGDPIEGVRLKDEARVTVGTTAFVFHAHGEVRGGDTKDGPTITCGPIPEEGISTRRASLPLSLPGDQAGGSRPTDKAESVEGVGTDDEACFHIVMDGDEAQAVTAVGAAYHRLLDEISQVVVGRRDAVEQVLLAVFCGGHVLLTAVPGAAQAVLAEAVASTLSLNMRRCRFTPDMTPEDVIGRGATGPVFGNMLLAEELNCAPPRVRAVLTAGMRDGQVALDERKIDLARPFLVLATQNPIEQEGGAFPFTSVEMDTFAFNVDLGYPNRTEERELIRRTAGHHGPPPEPVFRIADVLRTQQMIDGSPVADAIVDYARDLARATRPQEREARDFVKEMVAWGAGPRAGIDLVNAAKARAILQGRYLATADDVAKVALPVLRHRLVPSSAAVSAGVSGDDIVRSLLAQITPAPVAASA